MEETNLTGQFIMSGVLIACTFLVHGFVVALVSALLRSISDNMKGVLDVLRDVFVLMTISVCLLGAHFVSIGIWAYNFLRMEAFETLEQALYFSSATYTTLGYGDLLPAADMRILSGALAANGLLLFGLSAAILVDASVRLRLGGE